MGRVVRFCVNASCVEIERLDPAGQPLLIRQRDHRQFVLASVFDHGVTG